MSDRLCGYRDWCDARGLEPRGKNYVSQFSGWVRHQIALGMSPDDPRHPCHHEWSRVRWREALREHHSRYGKIPPVMDLAEHPTLPNQFVITKILGYRTYRDAVEDAGFTYEKRRRKNASVRRRKREQ